MVYTDSTLLFIGNVSQYFFDNLLVEQVQDITKTVHSPVKEPEPILQKDRPWEHNLYITVNGWSVIKDSQTGEFKCWYEDWLLDPEEVKRQGVLYCCPSRTCFARSKDGVNWEKPELDYAEIDGRKTNIVVGNDDYVKLESVHVFEDTIETDPQKRFKMMLYYYYRPGDRRNDVLAVNLRDRMDGVTPEMVRVEPLYSADGIEWTPCEDVPRFGKHGNGLGDACNVLPDPENGVYRLLTRGVGMVTAHIDERRPVTNSFFVPFLPNDIGRMNKRRVFLSESSDLIHWSRPQCIIAPDPEEDNLDDSLYAMTQFKIGEIYVGFVSMLHEVDNTIDVRLAYSRDGWRWHYVNQRQPWIALSADGWDRGMVNMSTPPVMVDDEMFVYYGGAKNRHDFWMLGRLEGLQTPDALSMDEVHWGLGLAKMRRDGFVSIDAGPVREGVMITRALHTEGHQLEINASVEPGGYIEVEVTDQDENVLEGCTRALCDTFNGDSTKLVVTWRGNSRIPHNGALRLRFFMRNASLYSLTMV